MPDPHAHAPIVFLHPEEEYFPMLPEDFIAASRFRHHRASKKDQGYNVVAKKWKTNNDHATSYYGPPVSYISKYRMDHGKNRRPRDKNNGKKWNVFLQPRGKPSGDATPEGRVPVYYWKRTKGPFTLISYWWFFGYNDGFLTGNHQGDWEHVTLLFTQEQFFGAFMAAHNSNSFYPKTELEKSDGKVKVYCAKGSHASYPWENPIGDQTNGQGYKWRTGKLLLPLKDQAWRQYAGAWGEVGNHGFTTGPLGPWQKRKDTPYDFLPL